jgi:hypothetical protein
MRLSYRIWIDANTRDFCIGPSFSQKKQKRFQRCVIAEIAAAKHPEKTDFLRRSVKGHCVAGTLYVGLGHELKYHTVSRKKPKITLPPESPDKVNEF